MEQLREKVRQLTTLTQELRDEINNRIRIEEILLGEKAFLEAMENCSFVGIAVVDRLRESHAHQQCLPCHDGRVSHDTL